MLLEIEIRQEDSNISGVDSFSDLKDQNHLLLPAKNTNGKERLSFVSLFMSKRKPEES